MNDMLSLFDEPRPMRVRVAPVPVVRFSCPDGCVGTFATFPAFLGHLTRHTAASEAEA